MKRKKNKDKDTPSKEELMAIATVTIDDVFEEDELTGKTRLKPHQQWPRRAKLGLNVETDSNGSIRSVSTGDRIKAIQMLLDNEYI